MKTFIRCNIVQILILVLLAALLLYPYLKGSKESEANQFVTVKESSAVYVFGTRTSPGVVIKIVDDSGFRILDGKGDYLEDGTGKFVTFLNEGTVNTKPQNPGVTVQIKENPDEQLTFYIRDNNLELKAFGILGDKVSENIFKIKKAYIN